MVKIRLTRTGRKNYAAYRVIAIEARNPRNTKALELLGHHLPHEKKTELNTDRIKYWLSVGAQPSETVANLLVKAGVLPKPAKKEVKKFEKKAGRKAQERTAAKAEKEAAKKETPAEVEETASAEEASTEPATEAAPAEETEAAST